MIKQEIQSFYKGLNTDVNPLTQPEGTYRYSLNSIISVDNNMTFGNESSNTLTSIIPYGYSVIGDIYIEDDSSVLFLCSSNGSEIGILDKNHQYTTLMNCKELNFSKFNSVHGTYRAKINNVKNIYWVDGINPPRCMDINNINKYLATDYLTHMASPVGSRNSTLANAITNFVKIHDVTNFSMTAKVILVYTEIFKRVYDITEINWWVNNFVYTDYASLVYAILSSAVGIDIPAVTRFVNSNVGNSTISASISKWDMDKLKLIKSYNKIPNFDSIKILENGSIKPGSYSFALQYLDSNLNPTNWVTTSNPVNIYNDLLNNQYSKIRGSRNISSALETYGPTNKAIEIMLSNFDLDYPYYRIAVIQSNAMTGVPNTVLIDEIRSTNESVYIYTGNDTSLTTGNLADIAINKEIIESAKCIEQLENRLLIANGSGKDVDYCEFQKYASKISSHLTSKQIYLNTLSGDGNPKDPTSTFNSVGYMPGEVYSFGIVYIFNDGTESPVFHIPGRNKNDVRSPLVIGTETFNDNLDYYENIDSYYPEIHTDSTDYWGKDSYGEQLVTKNKRFHKFPTRNARNMPLYSKGTEAINLYNYKLICTISANGSSAYPLNKFTGEPLLINTIVQYQTEGSSTSNEFSAIINSSIVNNPIVFEIYNDSVPLVHIAGDNGNYGTITGDVTEYSSMFNVHFDYVSTLEEILNPVYYTNIYGINFKNIESPDPRVVGYYIVRNKKEDYDRCVIDNAIFGNTVAQTFGAVTYNIFNKWTSVVNGETVKSDNTLDASGSVRDISNDTLYFYSPEHQFSSKQLNFDHIDIYGVLNTSRKMTSINSGQPADTGNYNQRDYGIVIKDAMVGTSFNPAVYQGTDKNGFTLLIGYRNINPDIDSTIPAITWSYGDAGASTIEQIMYVNAADNRVYNGVTYYNACQDNKIGLIKFNSSHPLFNTENKTTFFGTDPEHRPIYYGALIKTNGSSYSNFMNRNYFKEHNNPVYFKPNGIGNTINIFNGDCYVAPLTPVASSYYGMVMADRKKKDSTSSILAGVGLAILGIAAIVLTGGIATPAILGTGLGATVGLAAGLMAINAGVSMISSGIALQNLQSMIATDYPFGLQSTVCDLNMSESASADNLYGCGLRGGVSETDDAVVVFSDRLTNVFFESCVNTSLRTGLTNSDPDFINSMNPVKNTFDLSFTGVTGTTVNLDGYDDAEFRNYLTSKWSIIDSQNQDGRLYRGYAASEWYDVNPDFSRFNREKLFIHLPINYIPSITGVIQYPNRIWWSQESSQDEIIDTYQAFLTNNYIDLEQETGEITNLFRISSITMYRAIDNLYIQTRGCIYKKWKNYQEQVQNTDMTTMIGTGAFFDLPPIKVHNSACGLKYPTGTCKVDTGWLFVDNLNKAVFLFDGEKVNNISKNGMDGFFIEGLVEHMVKQLLTVGHDISDVNINGINITTAFDKNNSRVLITKTDFEFVDISTFGGIYNGSKTDYVTDKIILKDGEFQRVGTTTKTKVANVSLANASASSGWTINGDGSCKHTGNVNSSIRLTVSNLEAGKTYSITYNVSAVTSIASVQVSLENNFGRKVTAVVTNTDNFSFGGSSNTLVFNGVGNFTISNLVVEEYSLNAILVPFNDDTVFVNKSFTISYNLKLNTWVSFHSYLPVAYVCTPNNTYSFTNDAVIELIKLDYGSILEAATIFEQYGSITETATIFKDYGDLSNGTANNGVYRHGTIENYCTYYDVTYPFIIEAVANKNALENKLWNNLEIVAESKRYDSVNKEFYSCRHTFDKAIVYNGRQSTGLVTINTDTGFNRSQKLGEVVASRKEGVWRINNIRDCVISSNMSIFTKDWNSIKASYPIDKVVNGSATSFSKPWSSLERFRDRYVIARLIDSNVDNTINTVVHFITEESGASIR